MKPSSPVTATRTALPSGSNNSQSLDDCAGVPIVIFASRTPHTVLHWLAALANRQRVCRELMRIRLNVVEVNGTQQERHRLGWGNSKEHTVCMTPRSPLAHRKRLRKLGHAPRWNSSGGFEVIGSTRPRWKPASAEEDATMKRRTRSAGPRDSIEGQVARRSEQWGGAPTSPRASPTATSPSG